MYEDRGSKRSLNKSNQAAKTRPKRRFRGHGMAKWPHLVGGNSSFGDTPLSLAGFSVSAPGFDETAFDLWL